LGIESSTPCILAAADNLTDRRKGGELLINALRQLSPQPLTFITMGSDPFEIEINGIEVLHLGYIDHDRTKVLAYSAADIFVHPALADNLPNTILESMACGTPVVGFPIGGVPEMVRPGISGWLANEVSDVALADMLQIALDTIQHNDMRGPCRDLVETEFTPQLQAQRYISLFESIL
jgi:glycosyltransferase involved in cell wall biosynthesis